jgi:glycosyltransferase involved in cell wall biosynthesis
MHRQYTISNNHHRKNHVYALWIGCNTLAEDAHSDSSIKISVAGTKWQRGLIEGLRASGVDLQVLTDITYEAWPRGPLIANRKGKHPINGIPIAYVSYLNIPRAKQYLKQKSYSSRLQEIIKKRGQPLVAFFYNYNLKFESVFKYLHEASETRCFVIAADYPDHTGNASLFERAVSIADGAAFLSWDSFQKSTKSAKMHLDGGVAAIPQIPNCGNISTIKNDTFTLMYSGNYAPYCGIGKLIELFRNNKNQRLRLWLTGKCTDESLLEQISLDPRITYYGFVSDSELSGLIQTADALVSSYLPDDKHAWGRFPSKLLEYLGHLKPVLSTKTPGISPDFDSVLNYFDPYSQASFDNVIDGLFNLNECLRHEMKLRTHEFLSKKKLWTIQAQRVVEFVNNAVFLSIKVDSKIQ